MDLGETGCDAVNWTCVV